MRLPKSNRSLLWQTLVFALFGVGVGVLLIALPADLLLRLAFVIVGALTVLTQIPGVLSGLLHFSERGGKLLLFSSLISTALGLVMLFYPSALLSVLLGVYLIVLPLILVLTDGDKRTRLQKELPRMILGVVLVLIGPAAILDLLFDVAGWVILVLTLVYTAVTLLAARRRTERAHVTGNRIFADTDGDGSIDTVYLDTTGDGRADTATHYRENEKS
ncbi:MAG: hypothetical protein IKD02_01300 [Clostridia bacterium]|nr:hypothetical protein [Clostridia bacterium]